MSLLLARGQSTPRPRVVDHTIQVLPVWACMARRGRERAPFDDDAALRRAARLFRTHGAAERRYRTSWTAPASAVPGSTRPSATSSAYSSPRCSITNRVCRSVALRSRPAQDRRGRRSWTPRPHREGPRVQPGCLMINMPLELSQAAAYGGIAQRAVETIERNLRMAVEAGKAAGEIATQVDAKQITGALLSLLLEERREAKIAAAAGQSAEIAVDTARRIAHGTNGTAHGDDHLAREALQQAIADHKLEGQGTRSFRCIEARGGAVRVPERHRLARSLRPDVAGDRRAATDADQAAVTSASRPAGRMAAP